MIAVVDRTLLFLNLVLLLFVVLIPFATATMATYLTSGTEDSHIAMAVYAVVLEGMALSFTAMFEWSLARRTHTRHRADRSAPHRPAAHVDRNDRLRGCLRRRVHQRAGGARDSPVSPRSTTSSRRCRTRRPGPELRGLELQ